MKSQFVLTKIRKGFSIVEVAVAMGVVTLMLTTFLGIFGPAQKNVQRALSSKDANAMKDALSNELSILRSTNTNYTNSFEKAVAYLEGSHTKSTEVLVYKYKALPVSADDSGILPAYSGDGIPGKDYVVQTAVRKKDQDDALLQAELIPGCVVGPVFVVRMAQLINEGSFLEISPAPASFVDNDEAVVAFRAEFYRLPSNLYGFVDSNNWEFDFENSGTETNSLGSPVLQTNMAVRR